MKYRTNLFGIFSDCSVIRVVKIGKIDYDSCNENTLKVIAMITSTNKGGI